MLVAAALFLFFALPVLIRLMWWCRRSQWAFWDGQDCSATGLLPDAESSSNAAIYILSARTSGLKGALARHSWIVIRKPGERSYDRYDKMGWGEVIWKNGFPADGLWFSNPPVVERAVEGSVAARLIPAVEAAIASYPYAEQGNYCAWPGPNSNSFIAHILRAAPELGRLPITAIGRDFHPRSIAGWHPAHRCFEINLRGLLGFAIGLRFLEIRLLGLVGGIDLDRRSILVPAVGAIPIALPRVSAPQLLARREDAAEYFDSEPA
ncbi:DUF3750 domain-containing protein [Tianweitania populi]|uniref:DUF3750 domain-containing protein n=1 Tax=Tianweitania populi TaxID=1607949 RepID=A0A8J3DW27_9HYPH|nr:DUF3750 domain-containing protein [Tianweitania populi]GHD06252.1 hypothetical protein GCM10016234_03390 [Tianweitania populi]